MINILLLVCLTGITQEMINETRASTERRMLGDIQELLKQGEEVNQQDSRGATLVRDSLCLSNSEFVRALCDAQLIRVTRCNFKNFFLHI